MKDRLLALGRAVAEAGLVVASGGNIAVRADDGTLWVTAAGCRLDSPGELAHVDSSGQVLGAGVPTSELALHLAAMRTRPDVTWSVHLHPPMATLLHALDVPIRLITTDHAYYLRGMSLVPYLRPGSVELADAAAEQLAAGADVVQLRHHGCLVVADTADLALSRAVNLEAAAVATYRARMLGDETTACPAEFLEASRTLEV